MLAGSRKVPVPVIQRLRFDLGLPHDFMETLIPNFPDYFQVKDGEVELVCWDGDLAVSVIEKKAKGHQKGMPIEFPMKFSTGFEMEKKFKKWVDEWQKLPYVSPYENAMYLSAKSDEGDKWVVSVIHELLSLLYSKKTDRENLLFFGECLGLRSRIKQALLHHPGIFYISRKLGSHTVVLRDGYKRDLLVKNHPLMAMRYKYIHLMNMVMEDKKQKAELGDSGKEKKPTLDTKGEGEEKVDDEDGEVDEVSGSEVDESEDDYDDENEGDSNKELLHMKGDLRTSGGNNFDGSKRRTRNYEDKDEDENGGRNFSRRNPWDGNRGRTVDNPRSVGDRIEFGRDGPKQRKTRNYEAKDEDDDRTYSHKYSGDRGRTRDNRRFERKRDFKTSDESSQDGPFQRRTRNYEDDGRRRMWKREAGEDSKRKGFNSIGNVQGREKESRYKESSRSATAASA